MRFLGSGRCSVVYALTPDEAAEIAPDAPPLLCANAVLRISRDTVSSCPTCLAALCGAVGECVAVQLTHAWRVRCVEAHAAAAACLDTLRAVAHLTTNFSAAPARLMARGARDHAWIAVEVKPKAVWRPPRVVGIAVDGVDHYLHPVKLRQCRFSLMQLRKRERGVPMSRTYCPNDLLFADSADSIAAVLSCLSRDSANNFRVLAEEGFPKGPERIHFAIFAAALRFVGILSVLVSLQLRGTDSALDEETLDIELLYRWSTARDPSSVRWIVCDAAPQEAVQCACQSPTPLHSHAAERDVITTQRHIEPPLHFERCVDAFYASMTAKDISLIVSASVSAHTPVGIAPRLVKDMSSSTCGGFMVRFDTGHADAALCRVGVVDLASKRRKSLQHYYALDQEVLRSWDRQCGSSDKV